MKENEIIIYQTEDGVTKISVTLDGDIVFCRAQNMVENGEIAAVIIGDEEN